MEEFLTLVILVWGTGSFFCLLWGAMSYLMHSDEEEKRQAARMLLLFPVWPVWLIVAVPALLRDAGWGKHV